MVSQSIGLCYLFTLAYLQQWEWLKKKRDVRKSANRSSLENSRRIFVCLLSEYQKNGHSSQTLTEIPLIRHLRLAKFWDISTCNRLEWPAAIILKYQPVFCEHIEGRLWVRSLMPCCCPGDGAAVNNPDITDKMKDGARLRNQSFGNMAGDMNAL